MRRNTMSLRDFYIFSFAWTLVLYIWFRSIFYRNLPGYGAVESHVVLLGILIGAFIINLSISGKYARNRCGMLTVIVISFGSYAAVAYARYMKTVYVRVLLVALSVAVIVLLCIFGYSIPKHKNRRKILRRRVRRAYLAIRNIAAGAFVVILVSIFLKSTVYQGMAISSVVKPSKVYGEECSLENNIDTFLLLQSEEWEGLKGNKEKKLDILQTVVNCEGRYLSFNKPVTVVAAELPGMTRACYNNSNSTIMINADALDCSSEEILRSILHECYHCAQHQYVEIYNSLDVSDQDNFFMFDAARYADEIAHYTDGTENYPKYYSQRLEADARAYGITGTSNIFSRISEYLDREAQKG